MFSIGVVIKDNSTSEMLDWFSVNTSEDYVLNRGELIPETLAIVNKVLTHLNRGSYYVNSIITEDEGRGQSFTTIKITLKKGADLWDGFCGRPKFTARCCD